MRACHPRQMMEVWTVTTSVYNKHFTDARRTYLEHTVWLSRSTNFVQHPNPSAPAIKL